MKKLILGTRGSALALAQVELTKAAFAMAAPKLQLEVQTFVTRGDQKLDLSLLRANEAGGKGLFTKELEDALLAGTIDAAVHSLKDLPGHLPEGMEVAAVLPRARTADVLVAKQPGGLQGLPKGAKVGTSSVRRARQLQWLRPDLEIVEWRGNVGTRLRKLAAAPEIAGIILARAGMERLGFVAKGELDFEGHRFFPTTLKDVLLPAIGQGAIALECRSDRPEVQEVLATVNHEPTLLRIRAERALQRLLSGDCTLPVGVQTLLNGEEMTMRAILFREGEIEPRRAEIHGLANEPELIADAIFARLQGAPEREPEAFR
jgi:hydroxymethylbilane synthase